MNLPTFLVSSPNKDGVITLNTQNMGWGGTFFVTIQLFLELRKRYDLNIHIMDCDTRITSDSIEFTRRASTANSLNAVLKTAGLIVTTASIASQPLLKNFLEKTIAVSHHPNDSNLTQLENKIKTIVSLSNYQYASNIVTQKKANWCKNCIIPNIVPAMGARTSLSVIKNATLTFSEFQKTRILKVGFSATLVPGKGAIEFLKIIGALQRNYGYQIHLCLALTDHPNTLYDKYNELFHKELDGLGCTYEFLNNDKRFETFETCTILLCNPYAWTEAYSGTVLEFLGLGLPTFGIRDFGNRDLLPNYNTSKTSDHAILSNIHFCLSNTLQYKRMALASFRKYEFELMDNQERISNWSKIITGYTPVSSDAKLQIYYMISTKILYRYIKSKIKCMIKKCL